MAETIPIFNYVTEAYQSLGLSTSQIDQQGGFDIHDMSKVHRALPIQSRVFRANYFSFVFVKNGSGEYTIEKDRFEAVPGTIYFTNPGHCKSFAWSQLDEVYLVSFTEAFLKEYIQTNIFEEFAFLLEETVVNQVLPPDVYVEFDQLCQQLLVAYTSTSPYRYQVIGSLFRVALLKIKEYVWPHYNPTLEGNRGSRIVQAFKQCLEKHFRDLEQGKACKPIRLQDCAAQQNLHPNYLSIVIKSKTGKSVGTWIAEKTIIEAKAMLQNSSLSVKEIAYRLGFSESTHFSTYFRKYTNQSPTTYRRQQCLC